MDLIYAYIKHYKNYQNQEISFDNRFLVDFQYNILTITYHGENADDLLVRDSNPFTKLHLLVGKTGSGKTNLLQLIGMKKDMRSHPLWEGERDSYFLLYSLSPHEFFLEICNVDILQFPDTREQGKCGLSPELEQKAFRLQKLRSVRFSSNSLFKKGAKISEFSVIEEYGKISQEALQKASDISMIFNAYDVNAFLQSPLEADRETQDDFRSDFIGRYFLPYQNTALWFLCDYIREYAKDVETGQSKRTVQFVLSTHNFSDKYPLELPQSITEEYWTFAERERDEENSSYGKEIEQKHINHNTSKQLSPKNKFIHDLWTDYAKYLRKWIERILSFKEEIPKENLDYSGKKDVYQEFVDYYAEKEYQEDIDSTILPDGQKMSIVKRCTWLAEYIDRKDNRDPHGILWQIIDDIKDIMGILLKLNDRYFTTETFSIPVVEMVSEQNKQLFDTLFERMEQYRPDDNGIFSKELLPYRFTRLSTGEFQYAKVLGGIEEMLKIYDSGGKRDKILLLDEPETYMHPELARSFISRLYEVCNKYNNGEHFQIIISTHSPFIISDVLSTDVTRIMIDEKTGDAQVIPFSDKPTFGANIHTILADSFFLNYTIGEYSRKVLQQMFTELVEIAKKGKRMSRPEYHFVLKVNGFLPNIGDQLIRMAFENVLNQIWKEV